MKPAATTPPIPWYQRQAFHYLLLIAGSLLLYGWTISFGYNLDDDYVVSFFSPIERNWNGVREIFRSWFGGSDYRPLSLLSFWLERQIFGSLSASLSHLVNVGLFTGILIAMYRFVADAGFYADKNRLRMLALITGILFLAHPNHVSVVANIKSRDNLLSMLFGLLAARQFILAYDLRQYYRFITFFTLIVLGLLSKRDSYALILVPVLVILMFRKINIKSAVYVIGISVFAYLLSFYLYNELYSLPDPGLKQFNLHISENPLAEGSIFIQRLSLSVTTLGYYLKFLFIPGQYYFYFGYDQIPLLPLVCWQNVLIIVVSLVLTGLATYYFRRERIFLFCVIAFLLSIAYALNFVVPVAGIVMDRYNFIPSLFFCLAIAAMFRFDMRSSSQKAIYIFAGLMAIYCASTIYRTSAWKNHYSLFDRDLPHLERSANANRLAAGTYIHTALIEETRPGYDRQLTDSFINKGERFVLQSLRIYDRSPQAWELAGLCDLYRRQDSAALIKFQHSLNADSTYHSSINYIGFTYWNLLQLDSAIHYFNFVIEREPFFNFSANNLINLYLRNNRKAEADSLLMTLYRRYPEDKQLRSKLQEVYGTPFPPALK